MADAHGFSWSDSTQESWIEMRFSWVCILFVFCLPGVPQSSLLGNEHPVRYELEEDEWLFVEGKEYRYLEVNFDPIKREVIINNHIVFSESGTMAEQQNGPPGISRSDSLYSRVPMIIDFVRNGGVEEEAIDFYIGKVSDIFLWLKEEIDLFKKKEISFGDLQNALAKKIDSDEYRGCIEKAQIFSDGSFMWKPFSAVDIAIVTWSETKNLNSQKSGFQYISECLNQFDGRSKVVVLGFGAVSFNSGPKKIYEVLEQLRFIENTQTFTPGPFSERRVKLFGFPIVEKDREVE